MGIQRDIIKMLINSPLTNIDLFLCNGYGEKHENASTDRRTRKGRSEHEDVNAWEPFLLYWTMVRGIHRSPEVPLIKAQ